MDNISERTNYLNKELVDDITQYDLGSLYMDSYDFGKLGYYRVRKHEECRPDIISFRIYGTQNYWWFIMWFNGFMDAWNDITENQVIKYPSIQKLRDFLSQRLKKVRDNRENSDEDRV